MTFWMSERGAGEVEEGVVAGIGDENPPGAGHLGFIVGEDFGGWRITGVPPWQRWDRREGGAVGSWVDPFIAVRLR